MKKVIVISLGGSLIIPDKINVLLLEDFRKVLLKNKNRYKFVVVCGGGNTARNYINGLNDVKVKNKIDLQSHLGISATRLNARFLSNFFGDKSNKGIPHEMKEVRNSLVKNDIVFCGALRKGRNQTSDSTASKLAVYFECDFINLTDVNGLYDKNPKKYKKARFIPEITHKEFFNMSMKIGFHPGQHFVLDQIAAKIIKKYNIRTYILGKNMNNLDNLLNNKHFIGTIIE